MISVYYKLQIKNMSYTLVVQFQRVFCETKVKHNSLLETIHINLNQQYKSKRGCTHCHKNHADLNADLNFDGEFVIKY